MIGGNPVQLVIQRLSIWKVFGESNSKLLTTEQIEKENILRSEIFQIEHKLTYQIDTPLQQISPRLHS
jgi:hypothetical protein